MASSILHNMSIRGIAAALPSTQIDVLQPFVDDDALKEDAQRIASSTGVRFVREARPSQCASDLFAAAGKALLRNLDWDPKSINLLVTVTQTNDYVLPSTGSVLHGVLDLNEDCLTIDINQGCSGYVMGLWNGMSILSQMNSGSRALLLVGDTVRKFLSPNDRATYVLFGDAGTATAVERSSSDCPVFFTGGSEGKSHRYLQVESGGFRNPSVAGPASAAQWPHGGLSMDGPEVFSFASRVVPKMVREAMAAMNWSSEDLDAIVLHQANKLLLDHITRKLKVPVEKAPNILARYGNTSSASIPLAISELWAGDTVHKKMILSGFGVGFSWATAALELNDARILAPFDVVAE